MASVLTNAVAPISTTVEALAPVPSDVSPSIVDQVSNVEAARDALREARQDEQTPLWLQAAGMGLAGAASSAAFTGLKGKLINPDATVTDLAPWMAGLGAVGAGAGVGVTLLKRLLRRRTRENAVRTLAKTPEYWRRAAEHVDIAPVAEKYRESKWNPLIGAEAGIIAGTLGTAVLSNRLGKDVGLGTRIGAGLGVGAVGMGIGMLLREWRRRKLVEALKKYTTKTAVIKSDRGGRFFTNRPNIRGVRPEVETYAAGRRLVKLHKSANSKAKLRSRSETILTTKDGAYCIDKGDYILFPGGGIDEGETPQMALIRECWEECGRKVANLELLGTQSALHDLVDGYDGEFTYMFTAQDGGDTDGTHPDREDFEVKPFAEISARLEELIEREDLAWAKETNKLRLEALKKAELMAGTPLKKLAETWLELQYIKQAEDVLTELVANENTTAEQALLKEAAAVPAVTSPIPGDYRQAQGAFVQGLKAKVKPPTAPTVAPAGVPKTASVLGEAVKRVALQKQLGGLVPNKGLWTNADLVAPTMTLPGGRSAQSFAQSIPALPTQTATVAPRQTTVNAATAFTEAGTKPPLSIPTEFDRSRQMVANPTAPIPYKYTDTTERVGNSLYLPNKPQDLGQTMNYQMSPSERSKILSQSSNILRTKMREQARQLAERRASQAKAVSAGVTGTAAAAGAAGASRVQVLPAPTTTPASTPAPTAAVPAPMKKQADVAQIMPRTEHILFTKDGKLVLRKGQNRRFEFPTEGAGKPVPFENPVRYVPATGVPEPGVVGYDVALHTGEAENLPEGFEAVDPDQALKDLYASMGLSVNREYRSLDQAKARAIFRLLKRRRAAQPAAQPVPMPEVVPNVPAA